MKFTAQNLGLQEIKTLIDEILVQRSESKKPKKKSKLHPTFTKNKVQLKMTYQEAILECPEEEIFPAQLEQMKYSDQKFKDLYQKFASTQKYYSDIKIQIQV